MDILNNSLFQKCEISDSRFDIMIENAVKTTSELKRTEPSLFDKFRNNISYKLAFALILIAFSIIFTFLQNEKPPKIAHVNRNLDWEGTEINNQLKNIDLRIKYLNNDPRGKWNKQIYDISKRIWKMEYSNLNHKID